MSSVKQYSRWTKEDKIKLLHGLRLYGYRDIRNIAKLIPNKSPGAIRTMIYKYTVLAKETNKTRNPLDEWMNFSAFRDDDSVVTEALLYIMLYEDQPLPSETDGIDIRAIYEMLYYASANLPLPNLSQKNIEALSNLHEVLKLKISPTTEGEVLEFLNSINEPAENTPKKVYTRKKV